MLINGFGSILLWWLKYTTSSWKGQSALVGAKHAALQQKNQVGPDQPRSGPSTLDAMVFGTRPVKNPSFSTLSRVSRAWGCMRLDHVRALLQSIRVLDVLVKPVRDPVEAVYAVFCLPPQIVLASSWQSVPRARDQVSLTVGRRPVVPGGRPSRIIPQSARASKDLER